MSSRAAKMKILNIYKSLLRESQKFPSYNFRNYALRRVRDSFQENKNLADPVQIQNQLEFANKQLELIHRQVVVGHLFSAEKLVIESPGTK